MATTDSTAFNDALKLVQNRYIERTQNLVPMFWNLMSVSRQEIGGKGWQPSINIQQNESATAITENEVLPPAQSTDHTVALVVPKIHVATVELSGLLFAKAKNNKQAYVQAEMRELKSAVEVFRKNLNVETFSDGTGKIAVVNGAVAAATTVVVDDSQNLRRGMIIDFFTGAALTDTGTIARVLTDGLTIEMAAVVTVADNDQIVRKDIRTGATNKALTGLDSVFDNSSDYLTVDRTSASAIDNWFAKVIAHNSDLDEDVMLRLEDRILREDPMYTKRKLIISERVQQRRYFNILKTARRFVDPADYGGGYSSVKHLGWDWIVDDNCPKDVMYMLTLDWFNKYLLDGDIHIASKDGLRFRQVTNKDAFGTYLVLYADMACLDPRTQGKITGLVVPTL